VQTIGAVDPKLDALGDDAIATPVVRTGNLTGISISKTLDLFDEFLMALQRTTLPGYSCSYLATPGATVEIGINLGGWKFGDVSFNPDLPAQAFPMKAERGEGVCCELLALLTFGVGEKAEASLIDPLQEDHSNAGRARWRRGRKGHSVRVVWLGGLGFVKPLLEDFDGVGEIPIRGKVFSVSHILMLDLWKRSDEDIVSSTQSEGKACSGTNIEPSHYRLVTNVKWRMRGNSR
jgi:hypothetical protein